MGVYTTADKKRDEASEHLRLARLCIMEATEESNQWAEPYSDDFIDTLFTVANKISKLRRKI